MSDEPLTLSEAPTYLKVDEGTMYRMLGTRRIPAFKVDGF